jgi:acetolactate synthase-1/2/3 large subunit
VRYAFGVSEEAMAVLWKTLANNLEVLHCRHESGAAFAATEAYFAAKQPVVVFTTKGLGITNVLTGLLEDV